MKKKADVMLDFLVRLLLAIIIFVPVFIFVFMYFSSSDDYVKTLNVISDKVEYLGKSSQIMGNAPLRFDGKNGALLFFAADADKISAARDFYNAVNSLQTTGVGSLSSVEVLRPSDCRLGSSCLCVCSKDFEDSEGRSKSRDYGIGTEVYSCKGKLKCKSFDKVKFPSETSINFQGGMLWGGGVGAENNIEGFFYDGGIFFVFESSSDTLFVSKAALNNLFCFSILDSIRCDISKEGINFQRSPADLSLS